MSPNDGMSGDLDPFGPWRSFRDATMDVWAKSMAEAVNTEAFAQNMGAYLNTYLATSAPLQKFVEQYMETTLTRLSMPTRDEIIDLARRMTSIEMRLDDFDSKLDQIVRGAGSSAAAAGTSEIAALTNRLGGLEARTSELLTVLQELRGQIGNLSASTAVVAGAAEPAVAAKSAAARKSRAKPTIAEAAPVEEQSAQDVANDTAVEPFQNAQS